MKIISILFLLCFSAMPLRAYERFRNPDRFVSLAFKVDNYQTSGEYTAISSPNRPIALVERGEANCDYIGFGFNIRIPATESLTVDFDYLSIDGEERKNRNNNFYSERSDLNGYKTSLGFRLYLN